MFGDRVVCAAADLVRAASCEFAVLRALDTELGTFEPGSAGFPGPLTPPGAGAARERTLADFLDRFGDTVVEVRPPRAEPEDPAARVEALRAAAAETAVALRAGADVIHGATFFDNRFACSCEFLVRAGDSSRYTAHGTAPHQQDSVGAALELAALELAACAEAVASRGARTAPVIRLHWGEDTSDLALAELIPIYRARRRRLERIVEDKLSELLPVQWGDPRFLACGQCPTCTAALTTARDLLLVAGLGNPARTRLREAGVATIDRLAVTESTIAGLSPRTVAALRRQAETQLGSEHSGKPEYTVIEATALGALPFPSPGDLSLVLDDTPGEPLRIAVGGPDGVHRAFRIPGDPSAAQAARREAVQDTIDYLARRRRMYPETRVYYYTREVRAALLRCTGGYGVGEEITDELLCDGVLVDLYPIVRNAVIIGQRSYRLDALRELFGDTTVHEHADRRDETRRRDAAPGFEDADRHVDAERDCVTVLRLRDWLLERAAEERIDPGPVTERARSWCADPNSDTAESIPPSRPSSIEAALAEFAADRGAAGPSPHPAALMAAALGYHRRERQPLWWAHIDRLNHPVDEWPEAAGVLVADWGAVDTKWHHSPNRPTMRRYLTLTGRIGTERGAGATLAPGATVYTYYDGPVAAGMMTAVGRRATATAIVLGCSVDPDFDDTVRLEELLPAGCDPYDDLPIAIAPHLPAPDENAEGAVELAAQQLLVTLPEIPRTAIFDILARRPPRLRGDNGLPEVHGDHAAAVTAAIRDLDNSYVAVQGPSGTGKTSTAARVIERLVTRHRWRVGVVARSHPTVENMLDTVVEFGVLPELVAKKDVESVAPEWAVIDAGRYRRFLDNAVNGCVIGGAPADFANEELIGQAALDLLVIADAGSFALAETLSVGPSARNLLLLGDPAPTPARAAHPEPVDESVLGWLVDGAGTLPVERGYFLDRSWRMHPRVCEPISRLYYDDRLRSNETVTLARQLDGVPPGIEAVLVDHHGNTTESEAEAREVVRRVRTLLGASWTVGTVTRRLHPHDIFVVAPYGAQVGRIRTMLARAKIEDVLVGTPDRFRGREAAVVLLSMTTSTPADAPDGMSSLLSRGVLLAALCRAMWKAVIIRSTLLTEYLPSTSRELTDLAGFLELTATTVTSTA
ncbi:AAA domain-containing protein [Nocardia sp. NPDC005366]|uniref:bifunctional RecB family nuclease/DEAD/DEAH box helicase n=1 Tax=Nocardia sp. NPDC005366 TaxID=3156878 RepID=UPI0033A95D08